MVTRISVGHRTHYEYDRAVTLSPHELRLWPALPGAGCVEDYRLSIDPREHHLRWQRDAYGNHLAKVFFRDPARVLTVDVAFVATLATFNPFDFIVDESATQFPFSYSATERTALAPYLVTERAERNFRAWLDHQRARLLVTSMQTVDVLVALNRAIAHEIAYVKRIEPGVQTCQETLQSATGSCRDSAWLLVQALRQWGVATRFVTGYLVQLAATDGTGDADSVELHAWCEAYAPGAGWIGVDPTSGLLAGAGHIALAAGAEPGQTASVQGYTEATQSRMSYEMRIARLPDATAADGRRVPESSGTFSPGAEQ